VHFIANKARKIELGNIDVIKLFECTVDYTAYAILGILKKWCIDIDKVVAVVTNNESNVINAVISIFGRVASVWTRIDWTRATHNA